MLSWDVVPHPPRIIGPWFLWGTADRRATAAPGYGREIVRLVAQIVRENGATELLTSCVQGAEGPEAFYRRVGFMPTGEFDENGEIILTLNLTSELRSASDLSRRSSQRKAAPQPGLGATDDQAKPGDGV
jgi:diamine N-acetyltransferase